MQPLSLVRVLGCLHLCTGSVVSGGDRGVRCVEVEVRVEIMNNARAHTAPPCVAWRRRHLPSRLLLRVRCWGFSFVSYGILDLISLIRDFYLRILQPSTYNSIQPTKRLADGLSDSFDVRHTDSNFTIFQCRMLAGAGRFYPYTALSTAVL